MTEQEAYRAGWEARRRMSEAGTAAEFERLSPSEPNPEIDDDLVLSAAWQRGFDEACSFEFDLKNLDKPPTG